MLDGHLVSTAPPKKPCQRMDDITTWTEAFMVFCLVLTSSERSNTVQATNLVESTASLADGSGLRTTKLSANTPRRLGWLIGQP